MPAGAPYAIRRLLLDSEYGMAEVAAYSRKSFFGRCEPVLVTALLAAIAIFGGVLLCEATRKPLS